MQQEKQVKSKFYEYRQNNSGGDFDLSEKDGIAEFVIIEAVNADEANKRAEKIGIYFDGCDIGEDCDCCGDRWFRVNYLDGSEVPSLYEKPIDDFKQGFFKSRCFIHYLNGTFNEIKLK